jgi:hypothetical protein
MRDLMAARRAVKDAKSVGEQKAEAEALRAIDAAREASASGADLEPQTLHMLPGMRGIHDGRSLRGAVAVRPAFGESGAIRTGSFQHTNTDPTNG